MLSSEGAGVDLTSNVSNPTPSPSRMKRLETGVVRCDPGRKLSAPFSGVQSSRANQKPRAVGGSVYYVKKSGRTRGREDRKGTDQERRIVVFRDLPSYGRLLENNHTL